MTIPEAARLIRGPVGGSVELRIESPRGSRLVTLVRVAADGMGHGGAYGDRPCGTCRHCTHCREHDAPCAEDMPCQSGMPRAGAPAMAAPPPVPPPDVDESLAPEVWPPTKPGHHAF